jgi:SAM-dependent methyltransferase
MPHAARGSPVIGIAKRRLRRWIGVAREIRAFRQRRSPTVVATPIDGGMVDTIGICSSGVVSVSGWTPDLASYQRALRLAIAGIERAPTHVFRVPRPDVEGAATAAPFRGAVAEWTMAPGQGAQSGVLLVHGKTAARITIPPLKPTPYAHLHTHPQIEHRSDVYGSGAPVQVVSDEVLMLARQLPQPVLDFGCGGGALVRALRREGIEIYGLELDEARIHDHLIDEIKPFVTLYDGSLPTPFADQRFASVVCSEVLEHLPDPVAVIGELARLATARLLVTVPDMSAVPRGFHHGVVPWHLLEATHLNFFTQASLAAVLAPHASQVEFSRIGAIECDRMAFYTCLAAAVSLGARGRPDP